MSSSRYPFLLLPVPLESVARPTVLLNVHARIAPEHEEHETAQSGNRYKTAHLHHPRHNQGVLVGINDGVMTDQLECFCEKSKYCN